MSKKINNNNNRKQKQSFEVGNISVCDNAFFVAFCLFRRLSVLPRMTPNGNRVQVIRTVENTNGDFNAMAMVKGTIKTIDSVMRREPIYGYVFLLDLKYCQMSYLMSFTPTLTKNLMRCLDVSLKKTGS